jgi:hypothetical protein
MGDKWLIFNYLKPGQRLTENSFPTHCQLARSDSTFAASVNKFVVRHFIRSLCSTLEAVLSLTTAADLGTVAPPASVSPG